MKRHHWPLLKVVLSLVTMIIAVGCDQQFRSRLPVVEAVAVLIPTQGNDVTGVVTFYGTDVGMRVIADVAGLSQGSHGIHIHEFGDCRSDDGASAGGHFNPHGKPHGGPDAEERHAGDMGNIIADENGAATLDIAIPGLTLAGDNGIAGRSVVVHADEDDFRTQPHGKAGKRLTCGVIGLAHQR